MRTLGRVHGLTVSFAVTALAFAGCSTRIPADEVGDTGGASGTGASTSHAGDDETSTASSRAGSSGGGSSSPLGPSGQGGEAADSGGAATPVLMIEGVHPRDVTTDGSTLFWTTVVNEVESAPLSGGNPTTLMTVDGGTGNMEPLVYTASGLFVLAGSDLYRCSTSGASTLIASGVRYFVTDDDEVYWLELTGAIRRMALGGGSIELMATALDASTMGVNDGVAFFEVDHDLFSVEKGGEPKKVGYAGNSVSAIAFDSAFIYLVLKRSTLVRMPYDGNSTEKLYDDQDVSDVQVGGGYVYFLAKDLTGCGKTDILRYRPASATIETLLQGWKCIYGYTLTRDEILFAFYSWGSSSKSALYRMPLP